ncbi:MAG: ornithine cyclodeaminase family protein [Candidatus Dormibacterales bacterium]
MAERWGPTRLIARDEVERSVDMADALRVVQEVVRGHAQGRVAMPAKVTMDLSDFGLEAWNTAMPAFVQPLGAAGFKWVGGFLKNRERHGLPYLIALILVQDPETGYPLAITEGVHITNLRTGAMAALAVRHFGRSDARVLALVGAGVQARFAVDGITQVTGLERIQVYDLDPQAADTFAGWVGERHAIPVAVAGDAEGAVRGADLVITATTSRSPIVRKEWMGPGVTAISIGSQGQEFDDEAVLGADKIVVDSWEQCTHLGELRGFAEAGRLTRSDIFAEIGETVAGMRPGREGPEEYILVVPIGLGSLDIALAKLVHDRVSAQAGAAGFRFFE